MRQLNRIRCPLCSSLFDSAEMGREATCLNCKHSFASPVARSENSLVPPRIPFIYQDLHNPAVHEFHQKYELANVVSNARNEFDTLVAVRDWTFRQFPSGEPFHWNLDADAILSAGRRGKTFHCTFYAIVSVQAYTALGHVARRLNVDVNEAQPRGYGHMIYDVWCNELNQWVAMDSKANVHFELHDKPLSALEVRLAYLENRCENLDVVFGHGPQKRVLPRDRDSLYKWARGYDVETRNRNTDSWATGMLEMTDPKIYAFIGVYGANDLFSRRISPNQARHYPVLIWYDKYNEQERWWIKPDRKAEVYAIEGVAQRVTDRADFEWPVNQTELQASIDSGGKLLVNLWTQMPNFSHFEYRLSSGQWQKMELTTDPGDKFGIPFWIWQDARKESLEVRSVNILGVGGAIAKIQIG